ncbi:Retrovirus-related Pol polyprotein from transposon 297 [Araneus ventricosus]|uniref:Retrovirus-related Pol polyprotein from transposon 297 n=1 Tax=Araneus ventricosus TaxID=182803 RepID=A0A4Y2T3R4_ARAVE|nr:Retrovirus-related Pol polyprotein from transposon 297 [Araneus ventricosus]
MPFGLRNAPATFERLMDTVFPGLSSEAYLVYLDDIIIIGRTFEEHLNNLRKVFKRLQKANLKLSPKKCRFFQKEEPEGQIARWIQRLQEYDFEIQHHHGNADALSRRPCKESFKHCTIAEKKLGMETDTSMKILTTTTVDAWSSCEIQKAQLEDPTIKPILEKKLNSTGRQSWQEIAPESHATKRYCALWDPLALDFHNIQVLSFSVTIY